MEKPPATVSMLMLALALGVAQTPAWAASPADTTGAPPASTGGGSSGKPSDTKKKGTRSGKRRHGSGGSSAGDARAAADKAAQPKALTVFPAEQATVTRVFDERRRETVADAERAARAAKQDDRWHAVLYAIRELDSSSGYDVCFWRVVAYYRLGELARARKTRKLCDLAPRDVGTLDVEEATATNLQPSELRMAAQVESDQPPRPDAPQPVQNPAAYTGPSPTAPR